MKRKCSIVLDCDDKKTKSVLEVEMTLTALQWNEIFCALDSKLTWIKNERDAGFMPDDADTKKWINALADIMDEIETKVEV